MKKKLLIGVCLGIIPVTTWAEPYTCAKLGYEYDADDCPNENFMVRCPMNLEKVWCISGERCGKYPVKGEACHNGARITMCDQQTVTADENKRCRYEDDTCNSCWSKGVYSHGANCGSSEACCNDGWELKNGICVEKSCSKIEYPYTTDENTLAEYAGKIKICKSGNTVRFGYEHGSCNEMWQHESSNPNDAGYYKCSCQRLNHAQGYIFPFDKATFYTTFANGKYGDFTMCSDAVNSYYGYTHCFRGWEMVKDELQRRTGECKKTFSTYCDMSTMHPTSNGGPIPYQAYITPIIASDYKCVYDGKCTAETQKYEECNVCMSDAATSKKNGKSIIEICSSAGAYHYGFKDECFDSDGKLIGNANGTYFGMCYRECQWGSKDCKLYNVVKKNNVVIGMVVQETNATQRYIIALKQSSQSQYANAKSFVDKYYPTGISETDPDCGKGKWRLPATVNETNLLFGQPTYFIKGNFNYLGENFVAYKMWSTVFKGDMVYSVNDWSQGYITQQDWGFGVPMMIMEVK